jgi:hypothetical protein
MDLVIIAEGGSHIWMVKVETQGSAIVDFLYTVGKLPSY